MKGSIHEERQYQTLEESHRRLNEFFNAIHRHIEMLETPKESQDILIRAANHLQRQIEIFYMDVSIKYPNNPLQIERDYHELLDIMSALHNGEMNSEVAAEQLSNSMMNTVEGVLLKNLLRFVAVIALGIATATSLIAAVTIGLITFATVPVLGLPVLIGTLLLAYECIHWAAEIGQNAESFTLAIEEKQMKRNSILFFASPMLYPITRIPEAKDSEEEAEEPAEEETNSL
jgi:hypothetical protein